MTTAEYASGHPTPSPDSVQPTDTVTDAASSSVSRSMSGGRLLSIQYARAVAAISVVFFHAFNDANVTHYPEQVLQAGVDLFFVISGFIMWVTTFGSPIGPREFLRRRILRIVPLYWVFTAFAVLLSVAAPQLGKRTDGLDAVASFLFLPAVNPGTHGVEPVIAPGWTLNHEMLFYVIFALSLVLATRWRFVAVVGANVALAVLGWLTHGPLLIAFYTSPIILEFVLGVVVGKIYTSGWRLSRPVSTVVVVTAGLTMIALAAAWGQTADLRVVVWGVPAAVIILALALTERTRPIGERSRLRFLGDASYSIYIVHGIFLSAMFSLVNHAGLPKLVMIPIGGPLAVLAGAIVYRYVERPMTVRLRTVGRKLPPAVAVGVVATESGSVQG